MAPMWIFKIVFISLGTLLRFAPVRDELRYIDVILTGTQIIDPGILSRRAVLSAENSSIRLGSLEGIWHIWRKAPVV